MNRKIVSELVLATLLVTILSLGFSIRLLQASGTIYIRPDGSVDPPTASIQRDGDLYKFTGNIYDSIVLERDDIIIDGAGYILQGTPGMTGITLQSRNNVTIKNIRIEGFQFGILLTFSSNCHISRNTVTISFDVGIRILGSSENSVCENNITKNDCGIFLSSSSSNNVCQNNITSNNQYGIGLYESPSNTISGNNIVSNNVYGIWLYESSNNNTMFGNSIGNNMWGIGLGYSSSNIISGNNMTNNEESINLRESSKDTISGNSITNNVHGVNLSNSSYSNLSGNTISNNTWGIQLVSSHKNQFYENKIFFNNEQGIELSASYGNTLSRNNVSKNGIGILLSDSDNNTISGNKISENNYGLSLASCGNNTIYHNNFINNTRAVHPVFDFPPFSNIWDDVYPSGGNYWDDYKGTDNRWGENQDSSGSDMIGDVPYVIDENNKDRYPLMRPWPMNCWVFEDCLVKAISNSTIMDFNFDKEIGEMSFNVAADTSDACKVIVSKGLLDGAFNFIIDNVPSACSISWSSEFHMINFTYTSGTHSVKIIGEFANRPSLVEFPDINGDCYIGIKDLYAVARHFGESCP